jgi:hypothetical protein
MNFKQNKDFYHIYKIFKGCIILRKCCRKICNKLLIFKMLKENKIKIKKLLLFLLGKKYLLKNMRLTWSGYYLRNCIFIIIYQFWESFSLLLTFTTNLTLINFIVKLENSCVKWCSLVILANNKYSTCFIESYILKSIKLTFKALKKYNRSSSNRV